MNPRKLNSYPEFRDITSEVAQFHNYHGEYKTTDKNYVIYSRLGEVFNESEIIDVCNSFKDKKLAILTTRKYPQSLVKDYDCKIFTIPSGYAYYTTEMPQIKTNFDRHFDKIVLSLNNRAQWNRHALWHCVINFKLQDRFYFSYLMADRYNQGKRVLYNQMTEEVGKTWFNDQLDIDKIYHELPVSIDMFFDNDWGPGNISYYENSFSSFVNETYIEQNYNPFLTEKTFKPIAYGHPMLLFSSAGALQLLKELGFKTYDVIFDESYDLIESPQVRFETLLKLLLDLCQKNNNQLEEMYKTIQPTLEYNYNFFWNELHDQYKTEVTVVKDQVLNFLNL